MKRVGLGVAIVLVLVLVLGSLYIGERGYLGEVGGRLAEYRSSAAPVSIHQLQSEAQLQSAFNGAVGSPRLILLLSPT